MFEKKIVIDIDVSNCYVTGYKSIIQTFCKNDDISKISFWNTYASEGLTPRQTDSLRGNANALKERTKIVAKYGPINTSGFYGSPEIDAKDLVKEGVK